MVDGNVTPARPRVLVMTQLFPNRVSPTFSIFNKHQCAALAELCDVDVRATVPWFPGAGLFKKWSAAGRFSEVPAEEQIDALNVRHPRFVFVPKVGRPLAPLLYAASLWPSLRNLRGRIDVLLACWAFPDGVAAVVLARWLKVPCVIKVHGSDLNVLPDQPSVRRAVSWALARADRVIAVSRPLAKRAQELGAPAERVAIVRNGINRALFHPRDRAEARQKLRLPDGKLIIYVGRLLEPKGVVDLVAAFERLAPKHPELQLALIGDGAELGRCQALAQAWPGRVFACGALPAPEVADWIAASHILTLPSWNEGTPNVLLEALASGRRVVATNVGGIPDVVNEPELGLLVPPKDVAALADALALAVNTPYEPEAMTVAAPYSWPESAARVRDVLAQAIAGRKGAAA